MLQFEVMVLYVYHSVSLLRTRTRVKTKKQDSLSSSHSMSGGVNDFLAAMAAMSVAWQKMYAKCIPNRDGL